ncbi:MAG: hypothetical protein GX335_02490 [Firmicutes bacterium]|nr:hypothetical protein [Bacillota bacterium]
MKRISVISLLLITVLLAGCLSASVTFLMDSPLTIERGQETLDLGLKAKLSGFGKFTINTVTISIKDGEDFLFGPETATLDKTVTVGPLGTVSVPMDPVSLEGVADLSATEYEKELKGKEYILELLVEGTKNSTAKSTVQFK